MMIRVFPKSENDTHFLRHFDRLKLRANVWGLPLNPNVPVFIYIFKGAYPAVESVLHQHNLTFDILVRDLQSLIDNEERQMAARREQHSTDTYDFGNYHDYDEMMAEMERLSSNSSLVNLTSLAVTEEGRDVTMLSVSSAASDGASAKPVIYINCGIHAREWIAPAVCLWFVHQLIDADAHLLDTFDWWIVPLANPDGYVYTWTNDRMWRKNRKEPVAPATCHGVDLNRNFDAGFGAASNNTCSNSYGGAEPFSEPETRAVRDLLAAHRDRVKVTLFMHSFSQLWLSPYGVNTSQPHHYAEMDRVMARGVKALHDTYKTDYQYGSISNVLYAASGTAVDYCYETLGVVYSFLIELRDQGSNGFVLPIDQIEETAIETWNGVREMALAVSETL